MIKTFEQFKNDTTPVEEGLFDVFKTRKQLVKLQGVVADEYERLMEEEPKRFHDGESVLKAVEQFAHKSYEEIVTAEDALSFPQWWADFEKAHAYMLNKTVFNKQ